jgi:hypothetical protein
VCVSFMDLLEELDVGDPFLVISETSLSLTPVRVLRFSN